MKFNCHQKELARALALVARGVRRDPSSPVLGNVLLETVADGRLRVAATNHELFIIAYVPAVVHQSGAATLPAHTLTDWVKSLPDAPLGARLTARTKSVDLVCGRTRSTLKGIDAKEFPNLPAMESPDAPTLPAHDLQQAIESVIFAAAEDESRPILNGVRLQMEDQHLTLAAADGFRIAERVLALDSPIAEAATAVVPARALKELTLALPMLLPNGPVRIGVEPDGAQVWFDADSLALATQTVNGDYPDYRRVVPKAGAHTTRVQLECTALRAALKCVDVIARENGHALQLHTREHALTLTAIAAETGENVIEVPATLEGQPLEIAFNSRYLREAVEALDTEQAMLALTTPTSPGVLRPVGHDGQLCVIMPLNTHG
jgi:DNA polymerase-3 subunit beta